MANLMRLVVASDDDNNEKAICSMYTCSNITIYTEYKSKQRQMYKHFALISVEQW